MNRQDIATAFGVDVTTIDRWVRDGMPITHRPGRGLPASFNLPACVRWKIEADLAKSLARAESAADGRDLAALRAEGVRLRNEMAALALAERRGEIVSVEEISRLMGAIIVGGRAAVLAVAPARIAAGATAPGANIEQLARAEIAEALKAWSSVGIRDAIAAAGGDPALAELTAEDVE